MEYSITGSEVAELISCKKQDVYNSASYGQMIRKEFYVEVVDRPLSLSLIHIFALNILCTPLIHLEIPTAHHVEVGESMLTIRNLSLIHI